MKKLYGKFQEKSQNHLQKKSLEKLQTKFYAKLQEDPRNPKDQLQKKTSADIIEKSLDTLL